MASLPQQQQQQDQEERKEDEEEQQPSQSQLPETSEIKRLDDNTIRRITAEQAISDLSSIVKELVDNALDAESTTIKIRLFGQGLDIIEVSDDGNGVPIGSRPYMATRHATSKINCLEDIYRGTGLTMGFRGEALFAMSCVSDSLVVASRTIDDEVATKLTFSGKDGIPEQSIENKQTLLARKIGTTVAVVKPFSNLPARRADIQRRIRQQRTTIFKLVESFGILNVGVCFQLIDINNNREEIVVATSASSKTIKETSSTLLGPSFVRGTTSMNLSFESFFQNIQEQHKGKVVEDNDENENNDDDANDDNCYNWGIRGLISLEPSLVAAAAAQRRHQRGSGRISSSSTAGAANDSRVRNVQYYSINGRVVDLPKVTALLRKLWTTFSSSVSTNNGNSSNSSKQRKKPSAIFEFTLPNNSFDINLSPDKRTVLFTNEQELLSIIEKHVTKLWSNESSSVFVDGGSSSNVAVTQQQQQQQRNHQQQRGVPAARVSVDNSCRRCIRGPSYKHGHDTTCFLSQKYNGNGVTKDEKEEEEEHYQDNDDNDIDDDTIDTDIDNSDRMKYKRRFAFVHDLSKAKMQHDLAGRQKEKEHHPQQQQGNDRILRNNNIDNDKNDNNQNYHEDQIEIETEMRHHRRPLLKQSKLSTTVVVLDNNKASNPITMTSTAPETTSATNQSRLSSNNNNNNGNKYKLSPGEDDDHPRRKKAQVLLLPEKSQKEKEKSIITTTTSYMESKTNNNNAQSLATTRDHDTSKDCRERLPLLVDKISDLERRKWTEIQSKFNQSGYKDDEGGEEGGLEQQALLQTMISRSISVGGSKNMRTKEPITPDDFTTPDSPPPITTTTTDPQAETRVQTPSLSSSFSSYRKEKRLDDNDDDDDVNDGNAKFEKASGEPLRVVSSSTTTSSTLSSSSFARRPLSANLQQFAFQSNDKDSDNGNVIGIARGIKNSFPPPKETIVSVPTKQTRPKHSKKEENSNEILSSSTSHPSPATATATTTRTRTRTRQKVRKSLTVAEEKEKDDNIIPLPLDRETSRRTSTNSIEEQQDTEMASAGASDNCSTTTEDNRVVIWESFGSTEDVCYNARVERLNMRKRKHDIDVIRRNIATKKSDDDNTVGIENSEKMMNEVDKEVGFDDDDDDNKATTRNSSSPLFIRISKSTFRDGMQVIGQFNLGFILARCSQDHLWILDQHACEEKYNFEQLCKKTVMHEQPLIKPLHLELNPSEEACVLDHMDIFQANGFRFDFDAEAPIRHRLSLTALPHSGASEGRKAVQFGPSDVSALCAILTEGSSYDAGSGGTGTDGLGMYGNNAVRRHVNSSTQGDNADRILARLPKAIAMFASRACRTSVMIGTALSQKEMSNIVQKLAHVDMPWTCAHGRPTMRHVASVLPIFLKDERNAAEHIAVPTVTVTPLTQPDE